jgi:hypothetical protein
LSVTAAALATGAGSFQLAAAAASDAGPAPGLADPLGVALPDGEADPLGEALPDGDALDVALGLADPEDIDEVAEADGDVVVIRTPRSAAPALG